MPIVRLALASLWNRRATAALTVLAIALSVTMLLGVEKVRRDARSAFANTISGTDLIVGARSGSVQLLLYAVFRIGNATNNMSWDSYRALRALPQVKWAVPLSLGDSHRGFRVLGTSAAYFEHYRYARKQTLRFEGGQPFNGTFEAVLGATVARELGYILEQQIVLAHGSGELTLVKHDQHPFEVVGVLAPTGTPVDRTVHVSVEAITAIHQPQPGEMGAPSRNAGARFGLLMERPEDRDLTPTSVTAMLVGVRSKMGIFKLQRAVNQYEVEPLLAIIPGVTLQELWDLMKVAENLLRVVSAMVVVTGLLGMLTVILSSLEARRREMAVLRSAGARPVHVFALFMSEAGALALVGVGLGTAMLYVATLAGRPLAAREFGLHLPLSLPAPTDLLLLGGVVVAAAMVGVVPAVHAYRMALADGLSVRI